MRPTPAANLGQKDVFYPDSLDTERWQKRIPLAAQLYREGVRAPMPACPVSFETQNGNETTFDAHRFEKSTVCAQSLTRSSLSGPRRWKCELHAP